MLIEESVGSTALPVDVDITFFKSDDVKWRMIFLVKSAVGHGFTREILRRTWAGVSYVEGFQFTTVFVLGKTDNNTQALIDEEYARYGDILQLNIPDEYRFIILKTLGGMEWTIENLSDDVFYTSCDDDFMIDMAGLVDVTRQQQDKIRNELWADFPIVCIYKGRVFDEPNRNNKSKYFISRREYKWPYYPDYCLGGAYTTSVGVVRQLWEASRKAKPLKLDDVWITGVLRKKIGMPRQYVRRMLKSVATHYKGFENEKTSRVKMQQNWDKLRKEFENLTTCSCLP